MDKDIILINKGQKNPLSLLFAIDISPGHNILWQATNLHSCKVSKTSSYRWSCKLNVLFSVNHFLLSNKITFFCQCFFVLFNGEQRKRNVSSTNFKPITIIVFLTSSSLVPQNLCSELNLIIKDKIVFDLDIVDLRC